LSELGSEFSACCVQGCKDVLREWLSTRSSLFIGIVAAVVTLQVNNTGWSKKVCHYTELSAERIKIVLKPADEVTVFC